MDAHHTTISSNRAQPKLTVEAVNQFQEGINLLLSRWTALQMAVQNEWGGPHSHLRARQIIVDIFSLFTQSKERVYIDDVEDLLEEAMLSLSVEIDDGSIEEIAEKLMLMHEECLEGNFVSIQKLRETNPPRGITANAGKIVDNSDSDDEDEDEDDNNDNSGNMVDDGSSEMAIDANSSHSIANSKESCADECTPSPLSEVDDGWTKVGSRRNKGKRN